MTFTIQNIKNLIEPPGEQMPADKAANLIAHYTAVSERHNLQMTPPVKFVINYTPQLFCRSAKANGVYQDDRKGLAMFGRVGTGKTVASAFLLYCYETLGIRCKLDTAMNIAEKFTVGGDGAFWEYVKQYDGVALIVDELGGERETKHYGNSNPMSEWIMHRYASWQRGGFETHITGNLDKAQFVARYGERVYDRVKEFTIPTQFTGASMRGMNWKNGRFDERQIQ